MKFLATTLSILTLSSGALGCTRKWMKFYSAEPATTDDQAKYSAACDDIAATIADFSAANENIYGSDFTHELTSCDEPGSTHWDPSCYCKVYAWRFHEWQTTENKFDLGVWKISYDWTPVDDETVDC
ncbi:hypothetical protein KVR01_007588 [Diaporthe batatas]|uniref:uncharacterized protein n=1 Tax=Diaporthe batatas TaxID=748121 RepID=UPI001D0404BB|nr:uncharacterized protein KVR01_007588 [Diaporthe batatas]KAG8163110.1 hypothetical protein KVR01_007588 [Diaporthe batatas]